MELCDRRVVTSNLRDQSQTHRMLMHQRKSTAHHESWRTKGRSGRRRVSPMPLNHGKRNLSVKITTNSQIRRSPPICQKSAHSKQTKKKNPRAYATNNARPDHVRMRPFPEKPESLGSLQIKPKRKERRKRDQIGEKAFTRLGGCRRS
jgi:hypothetical protein